MPAQGRLKSTVRNAVRGVAPLKSHPLGDWRREDKLEPIRPKSPREQCLKLRRRGGLGERRRTLRHCHARAVHEGSSGAPPCHAQGVAGLPTRSSRLGLPTTIGTCQWGLAGAYGPTHGARGSGTIGTTLRVGDAYGQRARGELSNYDSQHLPMVIGRCLRSNTSAKVQMEI